MLIDVVVCLASIGALWPLGAPLLAGGLATLLAVRWVRGTYVRRFSLSCLDEFPRAAGSTLIAAGLVCGMGLVIGAASMRAVTIAVMGTGVVLALLRTPVYVVLRRLRRTRRARERLLLVGSGHIADAIVDMAEGNRDYGLDLVARAPDLLETDLVAAARDARASIVLLAFSRASEAHEVFEIRRGLAAGLRILAVPRYFDLINDSRADDVLFGMPVLRLGGTRPRVTLGVKRAFDLIAALAGVVLVAPFMLLIAPVLKRETRGRLLFRQRRIGKDGRPFELLKLQTMRPVAESASNTTWTVVAHDRIGPVGRFLRKTSLDELPQLWNIVRADMSFVGPRPERPHFAAQFSQRYPHYDDRHRMMAGLTGLAQIYDLRGDTSIEDRARFDNRYADHWSLWWDVKIILKTVPKVFRGAGG